jgi:uncharacterized protein
MGKILFWLGVFAAVFLVLKAVAVIQRKNTLKQTEKQTEKQTPRPSAAEPEPSEPPKSLPSLISCEKCGLHLPRQEAVLKQGHYFCSTEHAD